MALLNSELEQSQNELEEFENEYQQETEDGIKFIKNALTAASSAKPLENEESILTEFLPLLNIKGAEGKASQNVYIQSHRNIFSQFEKCNKSSINKRLKEIACYEPLDEELKEVYTQYRLLNDKVSEKKAEIKELAAKILEEITAKYDAFTEDDIKHLVVEKKWLKTIDIRANAELKRANQEITTDIKALSGRYACTLPEIDNKVNELRAKVNAHLAAMGINI